MASSTPLKTILSTSSSLIDQFLASLKVPSGVQTTTESQPSPLHLLSAAATSLKSTVTKISLLTITSPFTPSALVSTLQPLNTSILTSLVTATLLTASAYPESFSKECTSLTVATLRDLQYLLYRVKDRSEDGRPKQDIANSVKDQVTENTGKIWEDCDLLLRLAREDLPGYTIRKAKEWLELMKDAVSELEHWDPEEDDIDDQDWFGLDDEAGSDDDEDSDLDDEKRQKKPDVNRATISAGVKMQALTVLSKIPRSVHIVIKHGIQKQSKAAAAQSDQLFGGSPASQVKVMDLIVGNTRCISECIDEGAEAMYLGDSELCLKKAGEARSLTIDILEAVIAATPEQNIETKEQKALKEALTSIRQVDTGSNTVDTKMNEQIPLTHRAKP